MNKEESDNTDSGGQTVEHRLIERIKRWTGDRFIGDDCAILPGRGLVTCDMLVEGTHFAFPQMSLQDLGWKAVAVNLSDIAAMAGCRPRFLIAGLTLPSSLNERDFDTFFQSMVECARTYRCQIVGGDLTRGQQMVISLTVLGDENSDGVMRRNGARPGDVVIVSGDFGGSAAGLWLMQNQIADSADFAHCRQRHVRPEPRFAAAWALVNQTRGEGAMMDASDGLADALIQLARSSSQAANRGASPGSVTNLGIEIEAANLPIHDQTRAVSRLAGVDWMDWALYGGEDYELVACISPQDWKALQAVPSNSFVQIGNVIAAPQTKVSLRTDGRPAGTNYYGPNLQTLVHIIRQRMPIALTLMQLHGDITVSLHNMQREPFPDHHPLGRSGRRATE